MSYRYDAFFSYKRASESNEWHQKVLGTLVYWLKQELQRDDVRIFIDAEDIRTGSRWRSQLVDSLKTSKCVVCLWSPLYFQSKWCRSEWLSFVERGQRYNRNLVLPASYHDGQSFPREAQETQWRDFSHYASTMPKFWSTDLAVEFEKEHLKPFASDLAQMIREAPPFDDTFPIVEAGDDDSDPPPIGRIADV